MTHVIYDNKKGKKIRVNKDVLSFRPSVYGVILKENKVLLIKYTDGIYDIPGGGIEKGETMDIALKREIFEEVGLEFESKKIIDCRENFFRTRSHGFTHSIRIYYLLSGITGTPNLSNLDKYEQKYVESVEWISLDKLNNSFFHENSKKLEIIKLASEM